MKSPIGWTPERIERLRTLVEANELSFSQIAKELGTNRNAVIGKASRLKLKKPILAGQPKAMRKRTSTAPFKPRPRKPKPPASSIEFSAAPATPLPRRTPKRPHEARLTGAQLYAMLRQAVENTAAHTPVED